MAHGTRVGLAKVLAQVSAIVVIPILGGSVSGIVVDRVVGTAALWVFVGFGIGNLVAVVGLWLYIRAGLRRLAADDRRSPDER